MAKVDGRFIHIDDDTLKVNGENEVEVKIKSSEVLEKTVNGLRVKVSDTTTATDSLWSSQKTSSELSSKASEAYVDNAIAGLKWKNPVIDFKTQAELTALSPQLNDRYIVTDGTNQNKIAQYNGSSWGYTVALDNWTLIKKSDDKAYTYDADEAGAFKWVYKGGITQSESRKVEEFTLSASDIAAKKVTLTYPPVNGSDVELDVIGGCPQDNGTDFSVNVGTKEVSWSGLGLDGILAANDVLRISYSKQA
jgi:hypothetical protein